MSLLSFVVNFVYLLIGVAGFFTFLILENYPAATWAVISALISAVTVYLNWLSHKGLLMDWYGLAELQSLFWGGFGTFAVCFSGFVYHLTMELLTKRGLYPLDRSFIIPLIWAIIAAKSGILLMVYSHCYKRQIMRPQLLRRDSLEESGNSTD